MEEESENSLLDENMSTTHTLTFLSPSLLFGGGAVACRWSIVLFHQLKNSICYSKLNFQTVTLGI